MPSIGRSFPITPQDFLRSKLADTLTPAQRSERMSRIRSRDTVPELIVRRYLHGRGIRFQLHRNDLLGRPDLVLPRFKTVIFVHGCYWHAHDCQQGRIPATRPEFWKSKFQANIKRDRRNARALRRQGWRVFTVWECWFATESSRGKSLNRLAARLLTSPIRASRPTSKAKRNG